MGTGTARLCVAMVLGKQSFRPKAPKLSLGTRINQSQDQRSQDILFPFSFFLIIASA
jgi:hypothetical protein